MIDNPGDPAFVKSLVRKLYLRRCLIRPGERIASPHDEKRRTVNRSWNRAGRAQGPLPTADQEATRDLADLNYRAIIHWTSPAVTHAPSDYSLDVSSRHSRWKG
jgi:hypothetical protein